MRRLVFIELVDDHTDLTARRWSVKGAGANLESLVVDTLRHEFVAEKPDIGSTRDEKAWSKLTQRMKSCLLLVRVDEVLRKKGDAFDDLVELLVATIDHGLTLLRDPAEGPFVRLVRSDPHGEFEGYWRRLFDSDRLRTTVDWGAASRKEGPLLLEGEVGAGKTHLARQLAHGLERSGFAGDDEVPCIVENLGALQDNAIDSLIRGVAAKAFTGVGDRAGLFERANNGVLVLDDFQNASLTTQIRLLDVLDPTSDLVRVDARYGGERAGGRIGYSYRVRTVVVINEPIEELLASGRLRPDVLSRFRRVERLPSWRAMAGEASQRKGLSIVERLLGVLMAKHLPRWRRFDSRACRWVARDPLDEGFSGEWPASLNAWCWGFAPGGLGSLLDIDFPDNVRGLDRLIAELADRAGERLEPLIAFNSTEIEEAHRTAPNHRAPIAEPRRIDTQLAEKAITLPPLTTAEETRKLLVEILRQAGRDTGWSPKQMEARLRPLRASRMREWIEREFPELAIEAGWIE